MTSNPTPSTVSKGAANLDVGGISSADKLKPTKPARQRPPVLSICITTFNRAGFIGATLDSIFSQLASNFEVVIVDGASTDNTEQVVSEYVRRFANLHYSRQLINRGIDRDYDRAVQLAQGDYCWLMTDDDLLMPGAIAKVLGALLCDPSILLVNYQRLNNTMSKVVLDRFLDIETNRRYRPDEIDKLFSDSHRLLVYIGALIIKRSIWMSRDRERYFDTMLMHIAVVFQERLPGDAVLIAEPLVRYRDGNPRTFWVRMFEIFLVKLPETISSFAISDQERNKFRPDAARRPTSLLLYRAMGWYSMTEYRQWISPNVRELSRRIVPLLIALAPGILVNAMHLLLESVRHTRRRDLRLLQLRMSPFYYRNYRFLRLREYLNTQRHL